MDPLNRYYTEDLFSNILIKELRTTNPNLILDLGIGSGSLSNAAYKKWKDANYIGVDFDQDQLKITTKKFPFINTYYVNALNNNLEKKIKITIGSVDIAICNPPYGLIANKKSYKSLLTKANLPASASSKNLTSDIIFLAQNLLMLKDKGVLGIILPDTLLTSKNYECFRNDLINNHTIKAIIQLPENIFLQKTEAKTHILILQKGLSNYRKVKLLLADINGKYTDEISIEKSCLIKRMDFDFQKWSISNKINSKTLKDIGTTIKRGNISKHEINTLGIKFHHTSNFTSLSKKYFYRINKYSSKFNNQLRAEKGDIVLARVGKRCVGKVGLIKSGNIILTDCVYKITVPKKYLMDVWNSFNSIKGEEWMKVHSHGVCSKVISKEDLLNFPVLIK